MRDITLKELLEAGCHFGHQANRWHPKATAYIYAEREGVHIIDLVKTREGLTKAGEYLKNLAMNGGSAIFVGTKRQARAIVEEAAKKVHERYPEGSNLFYLLERWPGGLLTNFEVMVKNLSKMEDLKKSSEDSSFTKKERLLAQRELDRLRKYYGGLVGLTKLPDAIFLVDAKREPGCVQEAIRTGVTIVAICDTNTNPESVAYPIPANDDAVGSIKIITEYLAEAWLEGLAGRKEQETEKASAGPGNPPL